MSTILIAENILTEDHFSTATEQEGEYIGQPVPDSENTGDFRLLSKGDIEDFSYSDSADSDGAADGTTVIDSTLNSYGDDYFIGGNVAITNFIQDTGDFTEQDGAGRVALTSGTVVTVTDLDDDEEAWLVIDKGAAHYSGDFEFHVNVNCTANAGASDKCGLWAVANSIDTLTDIDTASGDYLAVYWRESAGNDLISLEECDGGAQSTDNSTVLSKATEYYLKIVRDESVGTYGTLYCYIYDDEAMTSLVDTLTRTLGTSKKDFRYLYWMVAVESGGTGAAWDGTIKNLKRVKSETKTVTDFAQSTGTITTDAFCEQVNANVAYALTVPYSTRDFRVELIDSGDAGDATFKWSHDGGTTYLGRKDPYFATWLYRSLGNDFNVTANFFDCIIMETIEGTWIRGFSYGVGGATSAIQRSTDMGYTWDTYANRVEIFDDRRINSIIQLKSGRILIAGMSTGLGLRIAYSDDDGLTWGYLPTNTGVENLGEIIVLSNGNLALVTDDPDSGDNIVFRSSIDEGNSFSASVTIVAEANAQQNPTVVEAKDGTLVCAYHTSEDVAGDYEIACKRSTDGGATWSAEIDIANYVAADLFNPHLEMDDDGTLYLVYHDETSDSIELCKSEDNGITWTGPISLIDDATAWEFPYLFKASSGLFCIFSNQVNGSDQFEIAAGGVWEAYSANDAPCAITISEQKLICDVGVVWHGGAGKGGDKWSFTPKYQYAMSNLIEDSPSKSWRSEQDNIACNILLDMGANVRHQVTGAAFFGCNLRSFDCQMNATDSWGSPSVDESISFDLATGTVDAEDGNYIQDTSFLANYKDHELKNFYFRMTSGTDSGVTWKIKDNVGNFIVLDTTAATNISATDTFVVFLPRVAATFTGGKYRYIRPVAITAQHTSDDYYKVGSMVIGEAIALNRTYTNGYTKNIEHDISYMRTPKGGMIPVVGSDEWHIFDITWPAAETVREEVVALCNYLRGKNVALIPDNSDMADVYLCKLVGGIQQSHRFKDRFDLTVTFEEVL